MIIFKPFLGLANRLRAINSAVALARDLNIPIKVVWTKDSKLNSLFTDLFEYPDDINIEICQPKFSILNLRFTMRFSFYMKLVKFLFNIKFGQVILLNKSVNMNFDLYSLNANKDIFIAAFYNFYPAEFDFSLFIPKPTLQSQIENLSKSFNSSTYGIHLRRTDNKLAIISSPTKLFEYEMDNIISKDKDARFFIASDSTEEKRYMIKKYGDRIITIFFETSRNSKQGMENAVIDLFLLSRTKMIIGSFFSTFSDLASTIGRVPLKIIKK